MKTTSAILGILLTAAAALAPRPAAAQADEDLRSRPGVTFGGRAMYFRPKDADSGRLNGGAQLRLHLTSVLAVEGSADYRQEKLSGTTVDVFPVQASLLIYLIPSSPITPYILGGGGWYYTHVRHTNGDTNTRFGPHAGAGLEAFLGRRWSIDGSWRYLWTPDFQSQDSTHPLGRNFSDRGFMLTTALNYRF
ncbi:MAG: porin family protein [Elusimicrobia bacterium]|nr:porin family protein [Elusimicrobiota bacterium]